MIIYLHLKKVIRGLHIQTKNQRKMITERKDFDVITVEKLKLKKFLQQKCLQIKISLYIPEDLLMVFAV